MWMFFKLKTGLNKHRRAGLRHYRGDEHTEGAKVPK